MDRTTGLGASSVRARALATGFLILASLAGPPALGQGGDQALRSYYTANGLLNRGLFEEAAAEYRAFLEKCDDDSEEAAVARYGLAVALARLGQPDDAIEHLRAIDDDAEFPFRAEAGFLEAQLLYQRGGYGEAAPLFRALASAEGDRAPEAAGFWVECLVREGDHAAALDAWSEILKDRRLRNGDLSRGALYAGLALASIGRDDDAVKVLRPALERDDDIGRQARVTAAECLARLGRTDDAAALFEPLAAGEDGRHAIPAALGLARAQRARGEPDDAVRTIRDAAQRFPDQADRAGLALELGVSLIEAGDYAEGERALRPLAGADERETAATAAAWLAKSSLRQGRPDQAAETLREAIGRAPASPLRDGMRFDLGVAQYDLGDAEAALATFAQVIRYAGDAPIADQARLAAAKALASLGRHDDASEMLGEVSSAPLREESALLAIEVASVEGDPADAARRFARWLNQNDGHPLAARARFGLMTSLARAGRIDEAEQAARDVYSGGADASNASGLLALGDACAEAEAWDRAEQWYTRAREAGAKPEALGALKLGLSKARQGEHADALPLLDEASRSDDDSIAHHALFEMGQSLVFLDRPDDAAAVFRRLLDDSPSDSLAAFAMQHLGGLAERAGRLEEAADWYARAGESSKGAPEARADRARALLGAGRLDELIAEVSPGDAPDLHAYAAIARARQGDCAGAARDLARLLDEGGLSEPVRRASLFETIWCARMLDRPADALRAAGALQGGRPDRFSVYAALEAAQIELARDDADAASQWLDRADVLMKDQPSIVEDDMRATRDYRRARLDAMRGDHESVVRLLRSFHDAHPTHDLRAPADTLLGDALVALDRGREAAIAYDRALEGAGEDLTPTLLLRVGEAHADAQDWERSLAAYERFLRAEPDSPYAYEARFGVGRAHESLGRHDEAIAAYTTVVEGHDGPTAARAQFQIGECLFAQGRHEEAVRELLRVDILYAYPEWSAAALYEAGRAFEQMRKFGEARGVYRDVVDRFADSEWAPLSEERLQRLAQAR